jgi:hypothetical protein
VTEPTTDAGGSQGPAQGHIACQPDGGGSGRSSIGAVDRERVRMMFVCL